MSDISGHRPTMDIDTAGLAPPAHDPHNPPQPQMRPAPAANVADPIAQAHTPAAAPQQVPPPSMASSETSANAIAAAQGQPPELDGDDAVLLSKPYKAYDIDVQHVRFREPTGADVAACGYPFRVIQPELDSDQIEIKIIPANVTKLIVRLSQPPLPKATVDTLSIVDWNACSRVVNNFFQQ